MKNSEGLAAGSQAGLSFLYVDHCFCPQLRKVRGPAKVTQLHQTCMHAFKLLCFEAFPQKSCRNTSHWHMLGDETLGEYLAD
jgi:hypothetical protein